MKNMNHLIYKSIILYFRYLNIYYQLCLHFSFENEKGQNETFDV